MTIRWIDGQAHKLCTGPAHDEPTWLPAIDKYFHRRKSGDRAGQLVSRCRLCINWGKLKSPGSEHGYVSVDAAWPYVQEAANRIGAAELARRTALADNTISNILNKRVRSVQKKTLRKIMLELVSIRRKNEHSINSLSAWRVVKRSNGYGDTCLGCGTTLGNYTEDCETCQNRKRARERRGLTVERV